MSLIDAVEAFAIVSIFGCIRGIAAEVAPINAKKLIKAMKEAGKKLGATEPPAEKRIRKICALVNKLATI